MSGEPRHTGPTRHNDPPRHNDPLPSGERHETGAAYWDAEIAAARAGASDTAWYGYMDRVYADVLGRLSPAPQGPSLKTDLYEEARGGDAPLRHLPPPRIGIDRSPAVVFAARQHLARAGIECLLLVGDVRQLPIPDGALRFVLSGSTLDHFPDRADLLAGLAELSRVLAPGGTLALTLDNPHNPILKLRRRLARLSRLRLRDYFVGETLGREEGEAALQQAGLEVRNAFAVAHAPRDPAMRLARLIEARGGGGRALVDALTRFDHLERWPTRWRTAYYTAFEAVKSEHPGTHQNAAAPPEKAARGSLSND